jgi:hypothetical protein
VHGENVQKLMILVDCCSVVGVRRRGRASAMSLHPHQLPLVGWAELFHKTVPIRVASDTAVRFPWPPPERFYTDEPLHDERIHAAKVALNSVRSQLDDKEKQVRDHHYSDGCDDDDGDDDDEHDLKMMMMMNMT